MTTARSAILLVGGMGTRLHPLTLQTPKPMLPVAGVPFTEHQIRKAREAGITEIVLATSFKAELFEPYFGDGSDFGISIKYAVEREPLGTGGAIRNAAHLLSGDGAVAIFNGDVLSSHDLAAQLAFHDSHNADVTLYLTEVADARAFGAVELDSENRVLAFNEKMENPPTNIINAGCYTFSRSTLEKIPRDQVVSVERETFPTLLHSGARVFGFVDRGYWLDIGTPAALLKASADLIAGRAYSAATPTSNGSFLALAGASIDSSAIIDAGSVIGAGARIGAGAHISGSIIGTDAVVGERARLKNSFVAPGAIVESASFSDGNFFGFLK
jgi:mannose-1-phosphate guanylyltransferase